MLSVESLLETKASMIIEVMLSYPKPSINCEKHKKIESLTHHYITYTCIPTQLWLSFIQTSSHEMKMY
jgi:hypothetical protein